MITWIARKVAIFKRGDVLRHDEHSALALNVCRAKLLKHISRKLLGLERESRIDIREEVRKRDHTISNVLRCVARQRVRHSGHTASPRTSNTMRLPCSGWTK